MKKEVDTIGGVGDKQGMFSKTRQNAVVLNQGLRALGRLRDVHSSLLLVLVLIIPTTSGACAHS